MITYRTIVPADLDRVTDWIVTEPVGWIAADRYLAELSENMYRPEWTWIAEAEGRVVGRALWWGPGDSAYPVALDCLDVDPSVGDRATVAAGLIEAALGGFPRPVQYAIKVAGGWREDPVVSAAVGWRRAAARAAGFTREVERLQFEWAPGDGVPAAAGTLRFAGASDEEFLAVFRRIAEGSLDAQTRASVAAKGSEAAAREEMDFYLGAPGKREWWRIACTPEGEVAGMAIPSATPYSVNVGYLGVVPEFRGRGYVDEVLGEITRIHAGNGESRITATTDLGNAPMAAAFRRAGYRNTEIRINLSNDAPS
ncbi:RimJ/RimL family protein N-acetyltransferase [Nonomuraea thailandensis]|uniref:RimJ/RimL family protein N-acetyltransferase n=1 Tax=Nonomuraea thailandensis TaxID=1188745 RepID=A0A9X2GXH0_9ACTN|nr:GNAT family N-acetyltransferase [Nonomuraea thailandensis]MCP2362718.1 RimJ/RimL family protein N-acetyltransferase [Nonomuraea thailandensis]